MKRSLLFISLILSLVIGFSSCKSDNNTTDSVPFYASQHKVTDCNHVEGFHNIPAGLIRYLGNARVENEFNSIFNETEGYNIVNFLKFFKISKENFKMLVDNYGLKLNETTDFDIDLIYGDDIAKLEAYFTNK